MGGTVFLVTDEDETMRMMMMGMGMRMRSKKDDAPYLRLSGEIYRIEGRMESLIFLLLVRFQSTMPVMLQLEERRSRVDRENSMIILTLNRG